MITDVRRIEERSALRRWLRRLRIGALLGLLSLFALEGLVRLIRIAPPIDHRNGWMETAPGIPYRGRAAMDDERLYWKKDGHCTPAGYRVLAEVLTRELDVRGLVP